eukprot:TRINITY_DN41_c0_g1_i3.p2 TRINITY_DN41_c0_g1~~TRINITY_DN41_c0_g1_i3.p2  ORF type:complete len:102 (-),score=70.35 TRINITY_DN41_c0_g1_i3:85-357(-)
MGKDKDKKKDKKDKKDKKKDKKGKKDEEEDEDDEEEDEEEEEEEVQAAPAAGPQPGSGVTTVAQSVPGMCNFNEFLHVFAKLKKDAVGAH